MKKLYIFIILSIIIPFIGVSQQEKPLLISKLTNNIYIYTTYNIYNGEKVPANGLYVTTNEGVILIETPWDKSQFKPLLDSIESKHHKKRPSNEGLFFRTYASTYQQNFDVTQKLLHHKLHVHVMLYEIFDQRAQLRIHLLKRVYILFP